MLNFWILWNNARNLHYIKKWNPRKTIRLADNKLQTKEFLGARNIPFAQTYAVISNPQQLEQLDFAQLPSKDFVIKPNHGSKGQGILVLKRDQQITKVQPEAQLARLWKQFKKSDSSPSHPSDPAATELQWSFKAQGKILSEYQIRRQCLDILDGQYSMTLSDKIIIEEKLIPGKGFQDFCEYGLADIRIIVFNLVPVAAMIRIPTDKSEGKANIATGGIGAGIDLGNGQVNSIFVHRKLYRNKFPSAYAHLKHKKIPFWDELLLLSSKVQYFVNLGYLALDRVITQDGPKLLEINARAGLEIQNIADIRLKRVLDKIEDLKIQDPEKGVQIAQTLFSKNKSEAIKKNQILYLTQRGNFKVLTSEGEESYPVLVQVNPHSKSNEISPDLYEKITSELKLPHLLELDSEILFKNLHYKLGTGESKILLGQKAVSNFLIKPSKKDERFVNILNPEKLINIELGELRQIDQRVEKYHKRYLLNSRLRPLNYLQELDHFIEAKGNYDPIFEYRFPKLELWQKWQEELLRFQEYLQNSSLKSPLLKLFRDKASEILIRSQLLHAYMHQDFAQIQYFNEQLFGNLDPQILAQSKEKIFATELDEHDSEKTLNAEKVREQLEQYLSQKNIFWVEIIESGSSFSRMSILLGKIPKIHISKNILVSQSELNALLAHEIDTHLVRYLNGSRSGWHIFSSGTAYYLRDEEGLAIWNALQSDPEGAENLAMYRKYYLLHAGKDRNFSEMVELMYALNPNRTYEGMFKSILRIKKGQILTAQATESYLWMKDKVYVDGYLELAKKSNTIDPKIYKGKIKFSDLWFII